MVLAVCDFGLNRSVHDCNCADLLLRVPSLVVVAMLIVVVMMAVVLLVVLILMGRVLIVLVMLVYNLSIGLFGAPELHNLKIFIIDLNKGLIYIAKNMLLV